MKGGSITIMLTVLFIALKLIGLISWSWWWVLSPIWITFAIGVLVLIPCYVVYKYHKKISSERK